MGTAQRHRTPVPTYQDFTQTVPNAPSPRSPGPAPFTLRPATSPTAQAPGRRLAVVRVVTDAVITTQQKSSEGQTGSPRSQPPRRGLPKVKPAFRCHCFRSTMSRRTIRRHAERPTPCRPVNRMRPVPRGAGTALRSPPLSMKNRSPERAGEPCQQRTAPCPDGSRTPHTAGPSPSPPSQPAPEGPVRRASGTRCPCGQQRLGWDPPAPCSGRRTRCFQRRPADQHARSARLTL